MSGPRISLRRALLLAAKGVVSAALLVWLFRQVGWAAVREELLAADLRLVAVYALVAFAGTAVSALKWQRLAAALGLRERFGRMTVLYLVGYFFNNLLPSSVGGDVVRSYELGRRHGRLADATASVFMERFTGFTVLLVWALAAAVAWPSFMADPRFLAGAGIAVGAYLALAWAVFRRTALESLRARFRLPLVAGLLRRAASLQDAILRYRGERRALGEALGWSAAFYLITVGTTLAGCLAVGAHPPVAQLFVAVPVMLLLFSVPISIGGIGLQEWAFFAVLTRIGVPASAALTLGVIFRVRTIAFGLIGGALFPLSGIRTVRPAPVPAPDAPSATAVTP